MEHLVHRGAATVRLDRFSSLERELMASMFHSPASRPPLTFTVRSALTSTAPKQQADLLLAQTSFPMVFSPNYCPLATPT